jgi:hypothetical protein
VPCPRAHALVEQLREASEALIAVVERIAPERWLDVPKPDVWSPGKDAEHVTDGARYHQWIVRTTLGQKVGPRPPVRREQMTAELSRSEVVALLRQRTEESASLIQGLTDEQLALPAKPPTTHPRTLAEMIEGQLINHYRGHRADIESKLKVSTR